MKRAPSSTALFFALLSAFAILFSTWLMFHTFSYDPINQSMLIASKCWSDFGAHIPMIRSFSLGANLDRVAHFQLPEYPIFPGAPIRYHFLFYMAVGILEKLNLRIDWALNSLSILGFAGLMILIGVLSYTLFKSRMATVLTILFFLFNGSLAYIRFFQLHPLSLTTWWDISTNTLFPSFGPWDGGLVSAFWNLNIYTNQRHLAAGFALGLLCIIICLFIQNKPWRKQLPYLCITAPILGILPFFHQPTLLCIGVFMAWYFIVFPKLRIFLLLNGILTIGPITAQLSILQTDTSTLAWYPGYLIHSNLTAWSFIIYWFHNLGIHLILIPIGFLLLPWKVQKIIIPAFLLFIIANLFKFSVEIAANHKFFNFFMLFGDMLSAYAIIRFFQSHRFRSIFFISNLKFLIFNLNSNFKFQISNLLKYLLLLFLLLSLTLSGIIDFFAIANDYRLPVSDIPKNEIATWINANTPKNAIFLNTSYLYNPASIAGRSIFLGWPYFAWSAGYSENRMPIMRQIYESHDPAIFCPILSSYGITYVTVENISDSPDLPAINTAYFRTLASPIFSAKNGYDIYITPALCP